jgi:Xaa-Pro dipeptidase
MSTAITDRTAAVQAAMSAQRFDALLVAAPANMAYVAGFHPTPYERLIGVVVTRERPLRVVVPSLEEEAARAATPSGSEVFVWHDEEGPAGALAAALAGIGGRIGIEKAYLSVERFELTAAAVPGARLDDCGPLLARLRIAKDEGEVELLRQAAVIVDAAVQRLAEELRPGLTEAQLAALIASVIRDEGGEVAFDPAVLAGPKSALPHGHSNGTLVAEGDFVIVDAGAAVGGYCSDITRTFVAGRDPDSRQRELFRVVKEAQAAGIDAVAPGVPCAQVDRAARRVIEEAGLGSYFVHRTGHGLGLEVHEPPYLTATNQEPLPEASVVTVEPGVYIEGYGGVRIEDDVVVRAGGPEVLTHAAVRLEPS